MDSEFLTADATTAIAQTKVLLVFAPKAHIVLSMEKPWYRKLFSSGQAPDLESIQTQADRGDADAQFSLGLKYASSVGTAQDYDLAARWYLKAADQSHSLAQFNLGIMYIKGHGVPRDEATAMRWFHKAAQLGDAGAQFNLGMRQHRDSIAEFPTNAAESKIEAYKWFNLAAAQGYQGSATACERVTLSMTHEELADGNHRAAAFVAAKVEHPEKQ